MASTQNGHVWEYYRFAELFDGQIGQRLPGRTLRAEQQQRTLKQAVVVGIGGTGTEIAARLKHSVNRFYGELGELKEMIQFVTFDTMPLNKQAEMVQEVFRADESYIHLGNFSGRDLINANRNNQDLRRWWEDKYPVGAVAINEGCKRIRQLGRLCLWRWRTQVHTALIGAINHARALDRQAQELKLPALGEGDAMRLYVISGSCGGTGSGMFIDLSYMLYRAALAQGLSTPTVRALLVMPTLHIEQVRAKAPMLVGAFQANAYAFFKELQHFTHHGTEFFEHCFNAHELAEAGEERLEDWRPASRVYLIDNAVGGLALRDLPDLFTLSADALFHLMITPLGVPEEGEGANVDGVLLEEHQGRIKGFSSAGVAYVSYPARTVARCLAAAYLRDLVYGRLTRDLTDAERTAAEGQAQRVTEGTTDGAGARIAVLDPAQATASLLQGHLTSLQAIAPSRLWIDQQERTLGGQWETILDAGDRLLNGWQTQAVTALTQVYNEQHDNWLADVESLTVEQVNGCAGTDSIYFARQALRELQKKVNASPVSRSSLRENETSAAADAAKNEVRTQARKLIKRTSQLKNRLTDYFSFRRQLVEHTVREHAAELGAAYRALVAQKLGAAIGRCDAVYAQLRHIGAALDDQSDDYDPQTDERLLTATTQLVPSGGVEGAVKSALPGLRQHLAADAEAFLRTPEAPLWALGSEDETSKRRASEEVLKDLLNVAFQRVLPLLNQRVDEAALKDLTADAFSAVLANMSQLAQPAWQLNLVRRSLDEADLSFVESVAKPEAMDESLLPQKLRGNSKPLDDRKVMLLRTGHGAPLHAMIPFQTFRGTYRGWVKAAGKAHREPAHIGKDWNEGKGILEDIFPLDITEGAENLRYFALGMFSDWLVREAKVTAAQGLVELNPDHGYVFRRGPNQYVAVLIEQTAQDTLRQRDPKTLCPAAPKNRTEACKNFDYDCIASGKLFAERLENALPWDELERHVNSYITYLRQQIQSGKANIPREQGEAEISALEEYLEQG